MWSDQQEDGVEMLWEGDCSRDHYLAVVIADGNPGESNTIMEATTYHICKIIEHFDHLRDT